MDTLSSIDYIDVEEIGYSPFVTLTVHSDDVSSDTLIELCECDSIENISLGYEPVADDDATWADTLKGINAYNIVNNGTFTGEGIRIGVYESGGICDINNTNLSGKDITIRDTSKAVKPHATKVTSVLATIAPDAEFYVSDVYKIGIDWFIDNNCDVVNCSFGYYMNTENSDGTFTDGNKAYNYGIDAVYDYQIRVHYISVIKSSGNKNTDNTQSDYNPQNKVVSPGYAYNVITVGGVDRVYTDSAYRWTYASNASYVCSTPKIKPNISAPFTVTIPNLGTASGTSFSAPLVTGCIALLLEANPNYCAHPERVMSLLTSTAQKSYDYTASISAFDAKVGAGIIDLGEIIGSNSSVFLLNTNNTAGKEIVSRNVYLTNGTELKVGLAWLIKPNAAINATGIYLTDYELKVYDPSGSLLVISALGSSNVEMVRKTITTTGTYRIVVYQRETLDDGNSSDWIALTYN